MLRLNHTVVLGFQTNPDLPEVWSDVLGSLTRSKHADPHDPKCRTFIPGGFEKSAAGGFKILRKSRESQAEMDIYIDPLINHHSY